MWFTWSCIKNINKICCLTSSSRVTLHGIGILFKCCERIEPPGQVQVRLMIMSLASLHVTSHAHFQYIIGLEFAKFAVCTSPFLSCDVRHFICNIINSSDQCNMLQEHVDTKSATSMFDLLRRKLSHTAAYPHLLSLLQHCILLPRKSLYSMIWKFVGR